MPRKKKDAPKDWYWEAEQDRIAADEDLKLIKSPEGWPAEGLECVGLWFLMFNLMARSARKGYLLDPADDRKPMSVDELAVLTGRSTAVVSRIQAVILQRRMFSINEDGIIYSRGLVRKEELRKIRSKAGKKGGLRSRGLLKQKLEQNTEQTLRIGVLNPLNSSLNEVDFAQAKVEAKPDFALTAHGLAQKWCFSRRGRGKESLQEASETFVGLIASGIAAEAINAEMDARKDHAEFLWEFRKRLKEQASKGSIFDSLKQFAEKENGQSK